MQKKLQQIISGQSHDGFERINIPDIKQSGFFDLPKDKSCRHPYHQPPSHIHIPAGKGYRHVCPGCGNVVDIIPQQVTL